MEEYIFIGIAAVIVIGPTVVWRVYMAYCNSQATKELLSKPFVCPNCGFRFYAKQRFVRAISENKAVLKCPNCGKRDICGRPYDLDSD